MGVYTRPDSKYFWMLIERQHGRSIRCSTRIPWDGSTTTERSDRKEEAYQIYSKRVSEVVREKEGLTDAPPPAIRFETFVEWYRHHVSSRKAGADRESAILNNLVSFFGKRPLAAVTRERVHEWMTERGRAVKPATVNRELDVLKHLLAVAAPKYLTASPIVGLRRLPTPDTEPAILSRAQERKLLKHLSGPDRVLVLVAIDTLMRLSDLLGLLWEHDRGDHFAVLNSRTGQTHTVPISSRVRRALNILGRNGPYVFWHRRVARKSRDHRASIGSMFSRACSAAGIPYGMGRGVTFDALRHTGASRMIEAGVDLQAVQDIGGWKTVRRLVRSPHPTDDARKHAVEQIGASSRRTMQRRTEPHSGTTR